jgi:nucleotide-binding universal stress UspA family protein
MTASDPQAPILVAYSPSKSGRAPVEFGIAASRITGAPLTIMFIHHGGPWTERMAGDMDDSAGGDALAIKHLREDLKRGKVEADVVVKESRTTAGGLKDAMDELSPAMIVLCASKHGAVGSAVIGSTIERVVHEAACPVAVVGHDYRRPENGVQLVGAAYVPTDEGRDALRVAAALARNASVKLRAVVVLDPKLAAQQGGGMMAEQHRAVDPAQADRFLEGLGEQSGLKAALAEVAEGVDSEVNVLYNEPADGLIAASRHVDLLVMGSRARGPRRAAVFGSVSRKVAEESACPVIILPRGTGEAGDELASHVQAAGPS